MAYQWKSATITWGAGPPANRGTTIDCGAGWIAVGGGWDLVNAFGDSDIFLYRSTPTRDDSSGWQFALWDDTSTTNKSATFSVLCLDVL